MKEKQFKIRFSSKARHSLKRIPQEWQKRIEEAIVSLQKSPFYGKKMWGKFQKKRRLKLWPYRIVYEVNEKNCLIYVLSIAQRGSIGYKCWL
ncbi:type II toxin-antitoxin system RelE/ParE family toxin [Candidatus Parcubacteria bacterium]|nr:type II toxin-antitoxin system RelE/ParE family toxin [Candidatus Parcubacteria bacterium]